jgi:hypothetical protein
VTALSATRIGDEATAYVAAVADRVSATLGAQLVGVWLTGSAALGDFDPRRSDLDIQAITRTVVPPATRRRLAEALSHPALACPVRGLEFVLYARGDLLAAQGPRFQLNLNTGPGMEQHVALAAGADPRFWFTVDVSIARQHAVRLAGVPAAEAFPALPRALVIEALGAALSWYAEAGGSPAQTVLGACRSWAWASDGRWRSKGESARWARGRLGDPAPVDKAIRLRDGADAAPLLDREVDAVVSEARRALAAAAGRASAEP